MKLLSQPPNMSFFFFFLFFFGKIYNIKMGKKEKNIKTFGEKEKNMKAFGKKRKICFYINLKCPFFSYRKYKNGKKG